MIKVELVDHMGDDLRVANVARVSFDTWKEEQDNKDERLINYLAKHEHTSPFRHTAISIRCTAPIYIARQLGKHQVGMSWNEVSRRYVDSGITFHLPDSIRSRPDASIKQGSGGKHPHSNHILEVMAEHHRDSLQKYERMVESGVAPEQARAVLPQSMDTTWIWTGSLMAFWHMCRLRLDGHAQVEAQQFAKQVEDIVAPLFPISWKAFKEL